MNNLRDIIPNNIIKLRKQQGLTQLDLAKRVNYSDKAVSRWEKGEVMPDIETLQKISEVFNVPLSYLLKEHNEDKTQEKTTLRNEVTFRILIVLAVWIAATIIFVFGELNYNTYYWQIFVWAVPVSCLILMYFNRKAKNKLVSVIVRSILCWSMLASIYLQFFNYQAWIVFIIGIPIQAAIIVSYFTKRFYK